jgi:hypothetical protein
MCRFLSLPTMSQLKLEGKNKVDAPDVSQEWRHNKRIKPTRFARSLRSACG